MMPDPLLNLEGRRVSLVVDGQRMRGRLISVRDDFLTVQPERGPRISINKYEVTSIQEEAQRVDRCPRLARAFWR
jgi:hypothetical protein